MKIRLGAKKSTNVDTSPMSVTELLATLRRRRDTGAASSGSKVVLRKGNSAQEEKEDRQAGGRGDRSAGPEKYRWGGKNDKD